MWTQIMALSAVWGANLAFLLCALMSSWHSLSSKTCGLSGITQSADCQPFLANSSFSLQTACRSSAWGRSPCRNKKSTSSLWQEALFIYRVIVRIAWNNLSVKHICLVSNTREALHVRTNAFGPQKPTPSLGTETRTPSAILDTEKAWAPPPVSPGSLVPRVDDWKRDWLGNFFHGSDRIIIRFRSLYWEHSWIPIRPSWYRMLITLKSAWTKRHIQ